MNKGIKQGIRLGMCGLVLIGAACSQDETAPSADEATPTSVPSQRLNENTTNASKDGKTLNQQVSDAVADLAVRNGIAADAITVSEARTVTWGSSALGCPQEGMNYTQAIVPGLLLFLEADGILYRYHGSTGRSLFYCPDERAVAPAYGPGQEIM